MKNLKSISRTIFLFFLGLLFSLLAYSAGAGNSYWDINGTTAGSGGPAPTGSWETANWTTDSTGSSATANWTDGDFPIFAAGTDATGSYTVTASLGHTIAGLQLQTSTGTLTVNGPGVLSIAAGQQGFFSSGSTVINAVLGGTGGLINQSGTLYLYGNNTYSGGTTFAANHLIYYNNNNSFGSGPITNTGTASILTTNAAALSANLPNDFWMNNSGILNFASGNTICSGNWYLQQTPQLKNNGASTTTLTVSGPVSSTNGAFGLTLVCPNSGKIVLSGPNTYTGKTSIGTGAGAATTTVSISSLNSVNGGTPLLATSSLGCPTTIANGTIIIGDLTFTAALIYTGSSAETSDRVINLAGTTGGATIQMDGTGPLILSSAFMATGAGSKTLTLQGSSTAANAINGAIVDNSSANKTSLTKTQTGTWVLGGVNTYSGNTIVNGGTLRQGAANAIPNGANKGTLAVTSPGIFDLGGFNSSVNNAASTGIIDNVTGGGTPALTIGANNTGVTLSGAIKNTTGTLSLIKTGTGAMTLTGANTYSGKTTISGGKLQIDADTRFGTAPGSVVPDSITISGGNGNALRIQTTSFTLNANRGITLGASGGEIEVAQNITCTYGGVITGTGPLYHGQNNTTGYGTTILNGASTYSGATQISAGTIRLGINGALPFGTSVLIGADNVAGSSLDLNTHSQTIGPLSSSPGIGANGSQVPNVKLTGALTIIETNGNTTFSGNITGNGGSLTLDSTSTGTLTLGGTNAYSYTGPTIINAGTLEIATTNGVASTNVTVASGATLLLDTNTALKATADLILKPGSPVVNLNFVNATNAIHYLSLDGGASFAAPGAWSSSSATPPAPNTSAAMTGTGYLSVLGAPTNTITSSQNPSVYGTAVTFTNVVSGSGPVPTGSVTFKDGAITLGTATLDGTGTATLTATNLSATTHTITVTYSGDANYGSGGFSTPYAQVVNKATLDISADGTLVYGQDPTNAVYASIYYGFQGTDTVSAVTGTANFTTDATATNYINSYVGTNYTTFFVDAGTLTAANYNFAGGTNGILTIVPAPVTVTNVLGVSRDYDGTTNVALDLSGAGVSAFVNGDEAFVILITSNAVGAVANKNIGVGKAVTVSGLFLAGDLGTNYSLSQPTTTATVSQTNLTVTAAANSRVYDGTSTNVVATPTVTSGSIQTGDVANFSEAYDNKNVGLTKTVTPSGSVTDGNGGANYNVTLAPAATGEIDQLPITVTAATDTKPYDGNMSSTGVPTLTAGTIAPGDTAPAWTQTFDSPNVGARTLTPSGVVNDGNGGANYNVAYDTAAGSITAIASATGLVSSQNSSTNGVSVTFTASVTSGVGTPTGDVVFLTNGTPLATVALVAGVASADTAALAVGTNTITAQYAAQANWLGSSSNIDQVVYSSVTLSQTNAILSITNNGNGTFTLGLIGTPGANYYLAASGDVSQAFASWPVLAGSTNTAPGPSGLWSFVVTNVAPAYYRSVAINPAP